MAPAGAALDSPALGILKCMKRNFWNPMVTKLHLDISLLGYDSMFLTCSKFWRTLLPSSSTSKKEAAGSSETLIATQKTIRPHNTENHRSKSLWRWYINTINKISPTCMQGRPRSVLERSEGFADRTEPHLQEIQGILPHVSGSSSNQSTQLGHHSHLDSHHWSGSQTATTPHTSDYMGKLRFYVSTLQVPHLDNGLILC
jgi:hypothetical protein